ncbi:cache domain-containing sensor histidine kinase [Paenibacillus arenilitoris]|uniref:Histidine kinase n=1 Tax=Paenibacillus arenilitoris TaxID=2772299 RepID=A0A927H866_9BACL|nr:histidine kinase [Paenibacillus arenilitoris]MBD2871368.1 histidine kinase [Paenibacillus arenilitoris]
MKLSLLFGQIKYRMLLITLIVITMSLTIGFTIIIQFVTDIMLKENEKSTVEGFSKVETSIELLLSNTLAFSLSVQNMESVQEFIHNNELGEIEKVQGKKELIIQLDKMLASYDFMKAAIIFKHDGAIGGSSYHRTFFSNNRYHPFYSTKEYTEAIHNPGKIVWATQFPKVYFSQSAAKGALQSSDIFIAGIRSIEKKRNSKNFGDVLLVSLKESVLRQYYGQLSEEHSEIVMLDEQGRLFSGTNLDRFGEVPYYFDDIDKSTQLGSFEVSSNHERNQVVYYRLKTTGWWIIKTMPVSFYQQNVSIIKPIMILVAIGVAILIVVLYSIGLMIVTKPLNALLKVIRKVGKGDLMQKTNRNTGVYEIDVIGSAFNDMLDNIHSLMENSKMMEREKHKLELVALQNQIKPHFFYNTIVSIRWMATLSGADNVADALIVLIKLLRPVFSSQQFLWTVKEELQFIENYLHLMELRFGNQVEHVVEYGDAGHIEQVQSNRIPRFSLQPIIENCFEHAFIQNQQLFIRIALITDGDILTIAVSDDGAGMDPLLADDYNSKFSREIMASDEEGLSETHIGLINVNKRVKLAAGNESGLAIESTEGRGTRVIVKINHKKVQESVDHTKSR